MSLIKTSGKSRLFCFVSCFLPYTPQPLVLDKNLCMPFFNIKRWQDLSSYHGTLFLRIPHIRKRINPSSLNLLLNTTTPPPNTRARTPTHTRARTYTQNKQTKKTKTEKKHKEKQRIRNKQNKSHKTH